MTTTTTNPLSGLAVGTIIIVAILAIKAPGVLQQGWDAATDAWQQTRRDERCPSSLAHAETDPTWAAKQQAELGTWQRGKKTRGLLCYGDQQGKDIASGENDSLFTEVNEHLLNRDATLKGRTKVYPISSDVEVKASWYMKSTSISRAVLVINHPKVCGSSRSQRYSCHQEVPKILPSKGQIAIWDVSSVDRGYPKTYTGSGT